MLDQQLVLIEVLRQATLDYAEWFRQLVTRLCTPQVSMGDLTLTPPASWGKLNEALNQDAMQELAPPVRAAQADLQTGALTVAPKIMAGQIDPAVIATLSVKYLRFQEALQRLERIQAEIAGEYDDLSLLRHERYLEREWLREMERLTRDGKEFCVCLARLDNIDLENYDAAQLSKEQIDQVRYAGALIMRCVRVFDDVFFMDDGNFFMILKQTNQGGALRFVKRLQKLVEESGQQLQPPLDLTLSCCVAEPIAGEGLGDILKQMRNDMFDQRHSAQDVVARRELSPLARYVEALPKNVGTG
jgi:PleD family two-component response regulator